MNMAGQDITAFLNPTPTLHQLLSARTPKYQTISNQPRVIPRLNKRPSGFQNARVVKSTNIHMIRVPQGFKAVQVVNTIPSTCAANTTPVTLPTGVTMKQIKAQPTRACGVPKVLTVKKNYNTITQTTKGKLLQKLLSRERLREIQERAVGEVKPEEVNSNI